MLIHIKVGDATFTPTEDDLTKAVDRFRKGGVVVNPSHDHVTVANCALSDLNERDYTVIVTAGSPYWQPTQSELTDLQTLFETALKDPAGSVTATRADVDVEILVHGDLNNAPYKIYFV